MISNEIIFIVENVDSHLSLFDKKKYKTSTQSTGTLSRIKFNMNSNQSVL